MAKPPSIEPLAHVPAWLSGAAGGATASLGQFIGTTLLDTMDNLFAGEIYAAMIKTVSFLIGSGLMALAGAVVAYFLQAKTKNRWALFLAGAAATSIATTALPGFAKLVRRVDIAPISVAFAQAADGGCSETSSPSIRDGVRQFFGLDSSNYRVVVGSFKNFKDAQILADKINNATNHSLNAFVDKRASCNSFYPVIVGPPSTTLDNAKQVQ